MKQLHGRGLFVTFEGIEGSGKTTQLAKLATRLRQEGYRVVDTREPGGTPLAERIRAVLLALPATIGASSRLDGMTPECETALVLAARSQHVTHVIEPALRAGTLVLCDRFSDSTLAYQGYARGLPLGTVIRFNGFATRGLSPDLTLLFDLPVRMGLQRRRRGHEQNRLDRESRQFHEGVRRGFLELADRAPRRIKRIDATRTPDAIATEVWNLVSTYLQRRSRAGEYRGGLAAGLRPKNTVAMKSRR